MRVAFILLAALTSFGCTSILRTALPFNDLPAPEGPYAVGTQIETWQDASRTEDFTDDPDDLRRIVVQYWYPSLRTNDAAPLAYITEPDVKMPAFAKSMGLPKFLVNHIRDVQTHSLPEAPLHPDAKNLPLIVFSHGLGGMKTQNSIQAEELASRGYVVIAADHAFDAFLTLFADGTTADYRSSGQGITTEDEFWAARGPQLATRTADVVFMLDVIAAAHNGTENARQVANPNPLWRRVDLSRIGVFGHSFGGATSIMALDRDPRIRAAVVLDGWMVPVPEAVIDRGAAKPVLYLGQESWGEPLNYEKLSRFEANSAVAVKTEILTGTKHMDFADSPHLSSFAKRVGFAGSVPAPALRTKLNADIARFFADHVGADSIEHSTAHSTEQQD